MILNNNHSTKAGFDLVRDIISRKYNDSFNKENIKAIFIKKLPVADVINSNKPLGASNTSHIACTTQSMHFFYSILGEIAFNRGLNSDSTFDVYVETLYINRESEGKFIPSKCTIWKFPKSSGDQIGLSKRESDGEIFYELREQMYPNDILIFFKYLNDDNDLMNYVMLLKHDIEEDKQLIEEIVGSSNPKSFARYYEEIVEEAVEELDSVLEGNKDLKGVNKIYFGAPGTGKSKYVNDTYYNKYAKRVTFHPEYTYNDFVGYIRPMVKDNGNLVYEFVPGTFTEILVEALKDPNNMYSLIIEELNRANTAAVFGDLFQLLDRKTDGTSEYRVNNPDIFKYITKDEILKVNYKYKDGSIYIPNNLNIIATMNTADQNVFVMDTAFKRRWEFEYLPVKFDDDHPFKNNTIANLNIRWGNFVNTINTYMMSKENSSMMISEDKQIGPYFIKADELNDCSKFGYKVLLYLWDDVFKMDKEKIFDKEIRTFSQLINKFSSEDSIDIFNIELREEMQKHVVKTTTDEKEEEDANA